MNRWDQMIENLKEKNISDKLNALYGAGQETLEKQRQRYAALIRRHQETFGEQGDIQLISAPGRTEIGGNHTDHNHGLVLAAAVNLDIVCAVTAREDLVVRFFSEGYPAIEMDLCDLSVKPEEKGTTQALIRGVAAGMKEAGYHIGGFDAVVTSTVAGGSGLSSSAALEVMLTGVQDALYNRFDMPYVQRAIISQMAENRYFGKPSGPDGQRGRRTGDSRFPGSGAAGCASPAVRFCPEGICAGGGCNWRVSCGPDGSLRGNPGGNEIGGTAVRPGNTPGPD